MADRFITLAIHTYEKAVALRAILESEGVKVEFRNVNIEHPVVSSGVRVRIHESDLPLALRIIENREIFAVPMHAGTADKAHPILVPVDFTDRSVCAAAYAFRLAEAHNTGITLLHTYMDPYVAGTMQLTDSLTYEITDNATREQVHTMAETQMRHFEARIKDMIKKGDLPPVKFSVDVEEGVPEDTIGEFTRVNPPFMIVMATRARKHKEAELIGSVTGEVLDKCRYPVLAIPEQPDCPDIDITLDNVIFFTAGDQHDIVALDTLYRIYPTAAARITLALIPSKKRPFANDPKSAIDAICDYCRDNFKGYSFTPWIINRDTALKDVQTRHAKNPYSLIVVPNKKKNVFARLFNPSLAQRILYVSDTPLLVIPV